jgi:hypothetical protein
MSMAPDAMKSDKSRRRANNPPVRVRDACGRNHDYPVLELH